VTDLGKALPRQSPFLSSLQRQLPGWNPGPPMKEGRMGLVKEMHAGELRSANAPGKPGAIELLDESMRWCSGLGKAVDDHTPL
jgi:hypothetical protein